MKFDCSGIRHDDDGLRGSHCRLDGANQHYDMSDEIKADQNKENMKANRVMRAEARTASAIGNFLRKIAKESSEIIKKIV